MTVADENEALGNGVQGVAGVDVAVPFVGEVEGGVLEDEEEVPVGKVRPTSQGMLGLIIPPMAPRGPPIIAHPTLAM